MQNTVMDFIENLNYLDFDIDLKQWLIYNTYACKRLQIIIRYPNLII